MPLGRLLLVERSCCGYVNDSTWPCACVENNFMVWRYVPHLLRAQTLWHAHFCCWYPLQKGSLKGSILHDFRNNSVFEPHRARRMCFGDLGVLATCSACVTYPQTNLVCKNIRYNLFIFDSLRNPPPSAQFSNNPVHMRHPSNILWTYDTPFTYSADLWDSL